MKPIKYGSAPKNLGEFFVPGHEMMMYVYLPIFMPGQGFQIPERVWPAQPLVEAAYRDLGETKDWLDK